MTIECATRIAIAEALEALQPMVLEHGAARALPAIASAMAVLVVSSHRVGVLTVSVSEAVALLSQVFGNGVGAALSGTLARDGAPVGQA